MQTSISIRSGTRLWEITATIMLIMGAQIVISRDRRRTYTLSHKHSHTAHIAKRNYNQQQTIWLSMSLQAALWQRQRQQRAPTLVIKSKALIQSWIKIADLRLPSAAPIASWRRWWCRLDQLIHHVLSKINNKVTRAPGGTEVEEAVNKKKVKYRTILRPINKWPQIKLPKITLKSRAVAPIRTSIEDLIHTR